MDWDLQRVLSVRCPIDVHGAPSARVGQRDWDLQRPLSVRCPIRAMSDRRPWSALSALWREGLGPATGTQRAMTDRRPLSNIGYLQQVFQVLQHGLSGFVHAVEHHDVAIGVHQKQDGLSLGNTV